ncbi:DNA sulfur modification protein DndB [Mammaliicoccus sciuri]|uniref:DNA sulfur modification protein DndB n=1 Tax=Mammaliicoccus sciuri TaxID=1296 RepID=UPI002DB7E9B2|nr:DNA sulfur modification protein DndB [Mammaliicoccus sciuri]MEB6196557.1 hypothetical protein [Mammaliicoccus sciuri]
MKRIVNEYYQYKQRFLTTILNYETLIEKSEVLHYGKDKFGYQREVNKLHLNRMVNTLKNTNEVLSPTSIILGVNSSEIEKCLEEVSICQKIDFYDKNEKLWILDINKMKDLRFRIIDGQHRISAFEKYLSDVSNEDEKADHLKKTYLFNVVIVVLDDVDRIKEVELFRTINSKAKPLKTDLAMLAKYNYEILFERTNGIDFLEHIKARIIFMLNENYSHTKDPYWTNGIKVDVNNSQALGSIGFKAFSESIHGIVKKYVDSNHELFEELLKKEFPEVNSTLDRSAKEIVEGVLLPVWRIVFKKWYKTILEKKNIKNEEIEVTYYDKNYYIQQTMGVKSLHGLLNELFVSYEEMIENIHKFESIIENSSLKSEDWKKNGKMRGLSSEAGFKIIREIIKNQEFN